RRGDRAVGARRPRSARPKLDRVEAVARASQASSRAVREVALRVAVRRWRLRPVGGHGCWHEAAALGLEAVPRELPDLPVVADLVQVEAAHLVFGAVEE